MDKIVGNSSLKKEKCSFDCILIVSVNMELTCPAKNLQFVSSVVSQSIKCTIHKLI